MNSSPAPVQQQPPLFMLDELLLVLAMKYVPGPLDVMSLFSRLQKAHWQYKDDFVDTSPDIVPDMNFHDFAQEMFLRSESLRPALGDFEAKYEEFWRQLEKVPVFGGVLLNAEMTKVLLVTAQKKKFWGFPKGKIEAGETDIQCAMRELYEEVGFKDGLQYLVSGATIQDNRSRKMTFFIMVGVPENIDFRPTVKGEIGSIQWWKIDDIVPQNHYFKDIINPIQELKSWINKTKRAQAEASKQHAQEQQQQQQQDQERPFGITKFRFNVERVMQVVQQHLRPSQSSFM